MPELVKHDVAFICFLLLEAREVGLADLRQLVLDAVTDLVGEIRIDDGLSGFVRYVAPDLAGAAEPIRAAER